MTGPILLSMVLLTRPPQSQIIRQTTTGWCSPAIANVVGNVTVNCVGVDPRALRRLNEELGRKNEELSEKIREANAWAEQYHELEKRLADAGDDSELARQAQEFLHQGELGKAGADLDKILAKEESDVDRTAANHYTRALVFELQFQPAQALPHLEKAHEYRRDNFVYANEFALVLQQQNRFVESAEVFQGNLARLRELNSQKPNSYLPQIGGTLINLGNIHGSTQRFEQAESENKEALSIFRQLAEQTPTVYLLEVAGALNNLGNLHRSTQRFTEAGGEYEETLEILGRLSRDAPTEYMPYEASTLYNLAMLYRQTRRFHDAEEAFKKSLAGRRALSQQNPAYLPDLARRSCPAFS